MVKMTAQVSLTDYKLLDCQIYFMYLICLGSKYIHEDKVSYFKGLLEEKKTCNPSPMFDDDSIEDLIYACLVPEIECNSGWEDWIASECADPTGEDEVYYCDMAGYILTDWDSSFSAGGDGSVGLR